MSTATEAPASLDLALESLRSGAPVLVLDDESRENEGDVVLAASLATREWIGWTVRHTSGVLCAPMPAADADRLGLPPMVMDNQDPRRTAYTVSVDARFGIGTGISAADRARTLQVLAGASTTPYDLVRPGHVFPLRAVDGGVLTRPGHTEAAVDLCRLAGLPPVGVIAELVTDAGPTMRRPEVLALGAAHKLPTITIADLAGHLRERTAPAVTAHRADVVRTAEALLPTGFGTFRVLGYRDRVTGREHLAVLARDAQSPRAVVRVHSECLTGDVLGSTRCDCGPQLRASLAAVARDGGAVIYLRGHEGRGIGLLAKLAAYALQDHGLDTVDANTALDLPADGRSYAAAAAILCDLGLDHIRLLTNNPAKIAGLARHGITVSERLPLIAPDTEESRAYVATKRARMGHEIPVVSA